MDQNQKPHSRDTRTGSGSANVQKGDRVNTGSGPVGGNRPQPTRPSSGNSNSVRGSVNRPGRPSRGVNDTPYAANPNGQGNNTQQPASPLNLKKILILVAIVLVLFFVLKNCGGLSLSDLEDTEPAGNPSSSEVTDPSSDIGSLLSGFLTSGYASIDTDENQYSYTENKASLLNRNVSSLARNKYVTPLGQGQDTVTIMIYMCGTDLESKYGMASKDLQEMLNAQTSDKVNIVIETGGCSKWQNNIISNQSNQIYKIENGKIGCLDKNFGTKSMTDPANLTNFINYCKTNYPASRNILIFWDHGGGSVSGYGHDEKNPMSSSMTLEKIEKALSDANCKFDIIGFDACLMATFETALVCDGYADYLLASEETEPGTGWYYTRWITELSKNTSISSLDLGKIIVDDFITSSTNSSSNAKVTLSLVDLAELHGTIPEAFKDFATSTTELINDEGNGYRTVSSARAGVRQFAQSSKINQVDFVDLANRIGTAESRTLASVLKESVKYNRASMANCNGISIYFPYESTKNVKSAMSSYNALGIDSEYTNCIRSFLSYESAGQAAAYATQTPGGSSAGDVLGSFLSVAGSSGSSTSPMGSILGSFLGDSSSSSAAGNSIGVSDIISLLSAFSGRSMPAELDYLDTDLIAAKAQQIAEDRLDPSHIFASEKNGQKVLSLTDSEWSKVHTVELNVFVRDEDGLIDLGKDNVFTIEGNDLLLSYDGTWLCVNGNVCAYYLVSDTQEEDGSYTTIGRIPALLNGDAVNLQVVFDRNDPYGKITGAYPLADDSVEVEAKGLVKVLPGDTLQLLCDHYTFDNVYEDSYTLSDPFKVPQSGLYLENLELASALLKPSYCLTDYYGNSYWISNFQ